MASVNMGNEVGSSSDIVSKCERKIAAWLPSESGNTVDGDGFCGFLFFVLAKDAFHEVEPVADDMWWWSFSVSKRPILFYKQ